MEKVYERNFQNFRVKRKMLVDILALSQSPLYEEVAGADLDFQEGVA